MRSNAYHLILVIIPAICLYATGSGAEIPDVIQPVRVTIGRQDTVLISDLFYSRDYNLTFRENENLTITHNREQNTVVFQPKKDFTGATLVGFGLNNSTYSFPVIVGGDLNTRQPVTFTYKPEGTVSSVIVTGSFNNWSKTLDRMSRVKGDTLYELTLALEPGSYIYKFIVDGKEILDPRNPEKTPTGFDDFNSVLRVADADTTKVFLHIGGYRETKSVVSFLFVFESTGQITPLIRGELIALLDNAGLGPEKVDINGSKILINLTKSDLKGEKVLRLLVCRHGKTTNLQQIILNDGVPAGKTPTYRSWYDGIIYSIMIDRFNNGDKSNDKPVVHDSIFYPANYQGGDFKGIIRKIDDGYFNSLGINTIWISPVNDNPDVAFREYPPPHRWYSGYHGYWPISESRVEEKFGTMKDLKNLITKAHKRGIRILLDLVGHHVHIDHPFYRNHPEWFGTLDLPDGRKNLRLWDEYRLTTWFEPYMPSYDFIRSEKALEAVSDNAIWWLKQTGADGFRHDAVKHVPNNFWRTLTKKLKENIELPMNKKIYQIGETFGDYDLIGSYVNNGQLSAQFNFNLSYFAIPVFLETDRSFSAIDFHMKKSFTSFGYYNLMGNIMDSHDKVRYMAYADGKVKNQGVDTREMAWNNPPTVDHTSSYKKAELYLAYMFTIPGLPVIYYGSEFGMTGVDDPDNRRMMRFGDQLSFFEKQMLKQTRRIVRMRNEHSALRYGDFLTLLADTAVYAYMRSDMNERLLVVLNKTENAVTIDLRMPAIYYPDSMSDIISGEKIYPDGGKVAVPIPPVGWRVFLVQ